MTRSPSFSEDEIGQDPTQIDSPISSISDQIELEKLKNRKTTRNLRLGYAVIAVCFAIASIIFWMRFVQFHYDPTKHSDAFFTTLTTACTINILAAFILLCRKTPPFRAVI